MYQSILAQLYFGISTSSGSLRIECFSTTPGHIRHTLCVSYLHLSCPGPVPFSGKTCHRSIQTSYSSGTLLDGGSLASHSSNHVGRHSSSIAHCKRPYHGCFSHLGVQGSAITAFNPLAAHRCVLQRHGFFPPSVRQWQRQIKCLEQKITSNSGRNGLVRVLLRCTKQCHFCPSVGWFFVLLI